MTTSVLELVIQSYFNIEKQSLFQGAGSTNQLSTLLAQGFPYDCQFAAINIHCSSMKSASAKKQNERSK